MTTAQIRCLLAVLALSETYDHVESKNVAHLLGVKRPTIHNSLGLLQEKGLIAKELYGSVQLTEEGLALAHTLEKRRDEISLMFGRQFRLAPEESIKAALTLMSELSDDSLDKLNGRNIGSGEPETKEPRGAPADSEPFADDPEMLRKRGRSE